MKRNKSVTSFFSKQQQQQQENTHDDNDDSVPSTPSMSMMISGDGGSNRCKSKSVSQRVNRFSSRITTSFHSFTGSFNSLLTLGDDDDQQEQEEEMTDERRLYNALREACKYSEGIDAVEVWLLDGLHLIQPDGGWYRNPTFEPLDTDALDRIEQKDRDDYVVPPPQLPGTCLVGALWTTTKTTTATSNMNGSMRSNIHPSRHLVQRFHRRTPSVGDGNQNHDEDNVHSNITQDDDASEDSDKPIGKRNTPWSDPNIAEEESKATTTTKLSVGLDISSGHDDNDAEKEEVIPWNNIDDEGTPPTNKSYEDIEEDKPSVLDQWRADSRTKTTTIHQQKQKGKNGKSSSKSSLSCSFREPIRCPPKILDPSDSSKSLNASFRQTIFRFPFARRGSMGGGGGGTARRGSMGGLFALRRFSGSSRETLHNRGYPSTESSKMLWRDIHSLTVDPDQPTFLRLKLLEEAGFGKATGVRFDLRGQKGVVLYLAKSNTSEEILNASENCAYMKSAADLVGAAACLSKAKKAMLERKAAQKQQGGRNHENIGEEGKQQQQQQQTKRPEDGIIVHAMKSYFGKLKGGDLQSGPPPMSSRESILTFFGSFTTLLILASLSDSIKGASNDQYLIILGPFGALMTLQYGLTMAPASQPRNAFYGQAVAICIAMAFTHIPDSILAPYVRVPLATSSVIALMTRLGITHPPAGAAAVIISSSSADHNNSFDWMILPLLLLGNIISFATATLVNNLSDKRAYPTSWNVPASIFGTFNYKNNKHRHQPQQSIQ